MLEGTTSADAVRVAKRVRAGISRAPFEVEGGKALGITCSLGLATAPPLPADEGLLLRAADDALLSAKRAGRDRVVVA